MLRSILFGVAFIVLAGTIVVAIVRGTPGIVLIASTFVTALAASAVPRRSTRCLARSRGEAPPAIAKPAYLRYVLAR